MVKRLLFSVLLLLIALGSNAQYVINSYNFGDPDANAYFLANTSITSSADKAAIITFFQGLKADGIYTKIKAMYFPIWGSTDSKWNLVDPRDLDAAYRLSFQGSWTYTTTGATPNGSTAYARTFLVPSSALSQNSQHLSYYSGTSGSTTGVEMGCWNGYSFHFISFNTNGTGYAIISQPNTGTYTFSPVGSDGYLVASRTASNSTKAFRNNSSVMTSTTASSTQASIEIYLAARNDSGTTNWFSNKQCRFATIGDGLTDTDITNLTNRVNTLLTHFGLNTF